MVSEASLPTVLDYLILLFIPQCYQHWTMHICKHTVVQSLVASLKLLLLDAEIVLVAYK